MKKYLRVFEIDPGGWLLLSAIYFFVDADAFLILLMCVAIHEMGHLVVLDLYGVRVRRIVFDFTGLTIYFSQSQLFGVRECVAALAGPVFGLFAAGISSVIGNALHSEYLLFFAGGNFLLSIFNLLPAKPLDGWRFVNVMTPMVAQILSVCTSLLILAAGICLMYAGYGTAMAIMGIVLLLQEYPRNRLNIGI